MEGGLNPKTAYALSDHYIEIVEQCTNLSALSETSHAMVDDFVRHVHRCKISDGISPQVRTACDLIALAPNRNWIYILSRKALDIRITTLPKVQKETGMTIKEYHNLQRVEMAKSFLSRRLFQLQKSAAGPALAVRAISEIISAA